MMRRKLIVQNNGYIIEKIVHPGIIGARIARDLRYRIEWWSNQGWVMLGTEISDEGQARREFKAQRERNRSIRWRLVAFNAIGDVALPRNWSGPCCW